MRTQAGFRNRGWLSVAAGVALAAGMMAGTAGAAGFTWDSDGTFANGNQDGAGTWSAANANWNNGAADVVWPNSAGNDDAATFGAGSGAAGTVTVSGSVNVNAVSFNAPGSGNYTIGGTTLTLNGTTPTITVASGLSPTINTALAGSSGFAKNGTGTLTLQQNSTFTGALILNAGTLMTGNFSNPANALGLGTLTINGGTLDLQPPNYSVSVTFGRNTTVAGNAAIVLRGTSVGSTFGTLGIGSQSLDIRGAGSGTTLTFGSTTLSGTPSFNLFSGATVNLVAVGQSVLGSGLIKNGDAPLYLTGNNSYTGNTVVNGGLLQFNGTIDGTSGRTLTVASGATVAFNSIANATLNRVVESSDAIVVALRNNSANNLDFSSSTGANLPNASLGASGNANYTGTLTPNGTTYRLGGGGATLTLPNATQLTGARSLVVAGNVALTAANDYSGATTLKAGVLTLSGTAGAISSTAGITLAGGGLQLVNSSAANAGDRVPNGNAIAAQGGAIYFNNSAAATVVYAETLGAVTVSGGKTRINLANNQNGGGGNQQTLTLTSLAQSGSGVVHFTGPSQAAPDATLNMIKNAAFGAATPAGQIIGPWATAGEATRSGLTGPTDYAVYDASGNILAANIAASTQDTWTNSANAYTVNGYDTLSVNRTMTSLRQIYQWASILDLNGKILETRSLMRMSISDDHHGWTITGGTIRQPGTAAASLFIYPGDEPAGRPLSISSTITDNTGALTLVQSAGGWLRLSGNNSYSGGTVVHEGILQIGSTTAIGTGPLTIYGGGLDSVVANLVNANNNAQNWYGDVAFTGSQNLNLGTGAVTMDASRSVTVSANTLTVGGAIGGAGFGLTKRGNGTLLLTGANTYSGVTAIHEGTLQLGTGGSLASTNIFVFGSTLRLTAKDVLPNNARLEVTGVVQLDAGVQEKIGALRLGGLEAAVNKSYGSTASAANIQNDVYFSGTGVLLVGVKPKGTVFTIR